MKLKSNYYLVKLVEEQNKSGLIVHMRKQATQNPQAVVVLIGSDNQHELSIGDTVWITNKNTLVDYNGEKCIAVNSTNIVMKTI